MVIDVDGYVYFKDRLGDTFRYVAPNTLTCRLFIILYTMVPFHEAII